MSKRILPLLLSLLLVLPALASCGSAKATVCPVHIEGAIFGGRGDDSIALDASFSPDWVTKADNTAYQPELAAFCAVFCADTYFRTKDLERGTPNRVIPDSISAEDYARDSFLSAFGFSDVRYIESYKEREYASDPNDSATLTIGYLATENDCDLYAVALRGCFSSGEWASMFDVGAPETAPHDEWTRRDVLKGVDVGANRALAFIRDYVAEHDDPSRKNCILITGHSRGGALAQCIGAAFEDDPSFRSCTYAFNSCGVTSDPDAQRYQTVFHIFDRSDLYSEILPFGDEPLYRYGKILSEPIGESDGMLAELTALKGRSDYRSPERPDAETYKRLFGERFRDRASLQTTRTVTESFPTEEAAAARLERVRELIGSEAGLGIEACCSAGEIIRQEDGSFTFDRTFTDGGLLLTIGRILAYGESAGTAVKELFPEDTGLCAITDLLLANAASLGGAHLLINSYVLTGHLK